jgi:hypothetical protein
MLSRNVQQLRFVGNFLENELLLHLEEVPLVTRRQMWLQHDGAPQNFSRAVMEFFNEDMKEDGSEEVDCWLGPLSLPT